MDAQLALHCNALHCETSRNSAEEALLGWQLAVLQPSPSTTGTHAYA
jgi:hypothetical protein